jgi:peptide maturation system protein (TIGR04066 family)
MENNHIKKTMIYPFNPEFVAIARYLDKLNPAYQIERLVMPQGYRCEGEDAGLLYNKPEIGVVVTEDFDEALDVCDCLIIADGSYSDRFRVVIIQNMELSLKKGKELICTLKLSDEEFKRIKEISRRTGTLFLYNQGHMDMVDEVTGTTMKLYQPQVPIIFIGEAINGLDAFEVALGSTYSLSQEGYKTATLVPEPCCGLLNVFPIPNYMFDRKIGEEDKIFGFNRYIKEIDQKEKPDVFVIQLPGAIMKFNDFLTAGFGIVPYLISLAVQADSLVFCSNYNVEESVYFENLSDRLEHQIGIGIDSIHISNVTIDVGTSMSGGKFSIIRMEREKVDQEVARLGDICEIPVYNCCNQRECKVMCKGLVTYLNTGSVA